MRTLLVAGAAALAVSCASVAYAQTPATTGILPDVTNSTREVTQRSDKPVFYISTSANQGCEKCVPYERLLAEHAAAHPELMIVKVQWSDSSGMVEPRLGMLVRGKTVWSDYHPVLTEENIDVLLKSRAEIGVKELALVNKIAELDEQAKEGAKPYNDQLKALQAQADKAVAADQKKLAYWQAKEKAARAPFEKKIKAGFARFAPISRGLWDRIYALQARSSEIGAPWDEKIKAVKAEADSVCGDLYTQHKAVYNARHAAVADLWKQASAAQDAGDLAKAAQLKSQIDTTVAPYDEQLQALDHQIDERYSPYRVRIDALYQQQAAATATVDHQEDVLRDRLWHATHRADARWHALARREEIAAAPYVRHVDAVKAHIKKTLEPFQEQADPIFADRWKVIGPIQKQLVQVEDQYEALVASDNKSGVHFVR
jgi:hypothetical protein